MMINKFSTCDTIAKESKDPWDQRSSECLRCIAGNL